MKRKDRSAKDKAGKWRLLALVLLLIVLVGAYGGWHQYSILAKKTEINSMTVKHQLEAIGELAAYQYVYTDIDETKDTRTILGLGIPGTTHSILMVYSGVIKVGYEIADLDVDVDKARKVITITLPEPKIVDNYIIEEEMKYVENNNIFNPIKGEDITRHLEDLKTMQLEKAEAEGIYEKAAENVQEIMLQFLGAMDEYEVEFS